MGTVTVLIAAYNAATFIDRAVSSALTQTFCASEILIVDDASTDNTVEVVQALIARDSRIRLVSLPKNGGPSVARNAGFDEAKGDWIAILDADDAFLPERLERMVKVAADLNADIVVDNFAWFDARTLRIGEPGVALSEQSELISLHRFVAQARPYGTESDWGLLKPMFRKEFVRRHQLQYPTFSRHGEDYLLMINAFMANARYVLTHTVGYLYTDRSSGMSRTRIDYDGMVGDTGRLISDPRVAGDQVLAGLFRERMRAIQRFAAAYQVNLHMKERRLVGIVLKSLRHPRIAKELCRFTWNRLGGAGR